MGSSACVVTDDGVGHVVDQGVDAVPAAPSPPGGREVAEDTRHRGNAGVEVDVAGRAGPSDGEAIGLGGAAEVGVMPVEGDGVFFFAREVVQGQAVAGRGVTVAGGVLPSEAGAVLDADDVQGATEEPGGVQVGDLVGAQVQPVAGEGADGGLAQGAQLIRRCCLSLGRPRPCVACG